MIQRNKSMVINIGRSILSIHLIFSVSYSFLWFPKISLDIIYHVYSIIRLIYKGAIFVGIRCCFRLSHFCIRGFRKGRFLYRGPRKCLFV